VHVDVEDVVPLFRRHLDGRPVVANAGVVDQNVHRPEAFGDHFQHPVHLLGVGDVEVHRDGRASRVRNCFRNPLGALAGTGGEGDAGAGFDEGTREGFSKARVAAGHDGGLAGQIEGVQNRHVHLPGVVWLSLPGRGPGKRL
jgi:hypothetical protein